jgi:hypothetical protein
MNTLDAPELAELLQDPVRFTALCWPDIRLYDRQVEIMYSLRDNDETIVVAGNQLGKDFITGLLVLWFFCSRSPCRIITSSSGQVQLVSVLWGEMRRFLNTTQHPLPLEVNEGVIFQRNPDGTRVANSYIRGVVTNVPENLQGHHLARGANNFPRTLIIFDEASSIEDQYYDAADTWAHRKLIIGNPLPCTNFFYRHVKAKSIPRPSGIGYLRKIMQIKAEDSPNVIQKQDIIPGVINYELYQKRRMLWDKVRQTIGLDAEFYEGAEVLLYPPDWLDRAAKIATERNIDDPARKKLLRILGVDPAEGGDDTAYTIVDPLGILYKFEHKTADTSEIARTTVTLIKKWNLDPGNVVFDRGGGGKQIVDYLRTQGYNCRTVAFGEPASGAPDNEMRPGMTYSNPRRREEKEVAYSYKNRRAEMYGMLRYNLLDPTQNPGGFAIPGEYTELRRQLSPLPLLYDPESRMYLPPKNKRGADSKERTLTEMLGCSPDQADSLVLAVFGLYNRGPKKLLGKLF